MKTMNAYFEDRETRWNPDIMQAGAPGGDVLVIPPALSEWIPAPTLLGWIDEGLDLLDWGHPAIAEYQRLNPAWRPRALFRALCYAALEMPAKNAEALLREAGRPTVEECARVLDANGRLLRQLIQQLLIRAVRERFSMGKRLLPPGLKHFMMAETQNRLLNLGATLGHLASAA